METKYAKSAYRTFLFWGICSSLGITISTLVDATLVGNFIGSEGLAIANIATPVFLIYALLGITLGSGANVLIGKFLGASDIEKANKNFGYVLSIGLIISIILSAISLIFRNTFCILLGATQELLSQVLKYLIVVFCSAPVFVLYHILSATVRTDGEPRLTAIASIGVIVTNLSLDLLFMKVLNWGLIGASSSLCIAELVGCIILLIHFTKKEALLKLHLYMPTINAIKDFISNGFGVGSAFIFQAIVMLVFNTLLLKNDLENGVFFVAVFGVMYTISTVSSAIFDGAGGAICTVISILAGEKERKGMMAVYYDAIRIVLGSGLIIALLFAIFAEKILMFFGLSSETLFTVAIMSFRIYVFSFLLAGVNVVTISFWQTIGRIKLASTLSILRNFLLMLVLGVWLISNKGIIGLSFVYVISEILCLLFILIVHIFASSKNYIEKRYKLINKMFEHFYPIEVGSMEEVANNLEEICEEWNIDYKHTYFINLIVEELIVNIMKFGLKNKKKNYYVSVKLIDNNGEYILRIRDNVNTYNPFDLRGDEIDKVAIKLITQKAKYYNYQRKLVFNYLYVII